MTEPPTAMKAARPPVGTGASPLVAQLLALALIALGVVGIEEALARTGAITQPSWTDQVLRSVDGLERGAPGVLVAGVLLAVAGVLLLPIVLKRRPRKAVALTSSTGVYLRTRDLSRVAASAIEGADAVTDVDVHATRRRIKVVVTTVAARDRNEEIAADVRRRIAHTVDALERAPRLRVSVRNEGL